MWALLYAVLIHAATSQDSGYSSHIYLPQQPSLQVKHRPLNGATPPDSRHLPPVGGYPHGHMGHTPYYDQLDETVTTAKFDPLPYDYEYPGKKSMPAQGSLEVGYGRGEPQQWSQVRSTAPAFTSGQAWPLVDYNQTFQQDLKTVIKDQCYAPAGKKRVENIRSCREQQIINRLLANYSSAVRPTGYGPTPDGKQSIAGKICSFNDVTMEFIGQLKFQQEWFDPRLQFPHEDYHESSWLTLGSDRSVWTPDTFFHNEQEGHEHTIDRYNRVIRIRHNGHVQYHKRLTMAFSCPMVLKLFPHDDQICVIDFGSYAYTDNDIRYEWVDVSLKKEADSNLPKFLLAGCAMQTCDSNTTTGVYGCLRIQLKLHREFSFFFMTLYIPSCMLVSVSFVSFWIDWRSAPSRVPLTIVTLLTVTTQANGINANLPPVSYTKAIDLWIGACTIFVFGALIEFAVVNYVGSSESSILVQSGSRSFQEITSATAMASSMPFNSNTTNALDKANVVGKQKMFPSEAPDEIKSLMVSAQPRLRPILRNANKPYASDGSLPQQMPYTNDYNYQPPSYDMALMQRQPPGNVMTSSIVSAPVASAHTQHLYNGIRKRPVAASQSEGHAYVRSIPNYNSMSASVLVPGSYTWAPHAGTVAQPKPLMAFTPGKLGNYYAMDDSQYTNSTVCFDPAVIDGTEETQALLMKPPRSQISRVPALTPPAAPYGGQDMFFQNTPAAGASLSDYPTSAPPLSAAQMPFQFPPPQVVLPGGEAEKYRKRLTEPDGVGLPSMGDQLGNAVGAPVCDAAQTITKKRRNRKFILFERGPGRAERIDQFARVLFPIGFVLFNVIYWTKFLRTIEPEEGCHHEHD